LPGHLTLLNSGLVEAFEFVTTGPGSLTIKVCTQCNTLFQRYTYIVSK
jgi:hypothetical protein